MGSIGPLPLSLFPLVGDNSFGPYLPMPFGVMYNGRASQPHERGNSRETVT